MIWVYHYFWKHPYNWVLVGAFKNMLVKMGENLPQGSGWTLKKIFELPAPRVVVLLLYNPTNQGVDHSNKYRLSLRDTTRSQRFGRQVWSSPPTSPRNTSQLFCVVDKPQIFWKKRKNQVPGDSIRDLLILLITSIVGGHLSNLWVRVTFSPSQKGRTENHLDVLWLSGAD